MKLFAEHILLADGWQQQQMLTIAQGVITHIEPGNATQADVVKDYVIPGMVNCHSHAFQRAFAGFSEQGSNGQDSFWTWRSVMYQFLSKLSANDAETIATQLYIEMVKMGYTRVAEFHYLHHQVDGSHYQPLHTMAKAIFNAAHNVGIGLTMLPVLYRFAGFGEQAPSTGQRRFINSVEQFNQLVTDCFNNAKQYDNCNIGIAPHSLRAVDHTSLLAAVAHVRSLDKQAPIHLHIAEQQQEVQDCLEHYGQRPVQWLLEHAPVDQHWCLIHATHITEQEGRDLANSGAIAGICPTTEANLGDGIFPTAAYLQHQGTLAIGSDSHISVNPVEELRWLEYAQRLSRQQRAVLANEQQMSVGLNLWQRAAIGGAQACNSNTGVLAVGKQADLLVLDAEQCQLYAHKPQHLLDSMLFASRENWVQDVMINGQWVVEQGQHALQNSSANEFRALLQRLAQ
jgi:formimidoylglutamate deiminase